LSTADAGSATHPKGEQTVALASRSDGRPGTGPAITRVVAEVTVCVFTRRAVGGGGAGTIARYAVTVAYGLRWLNVTGVT
jgi:hypothetical protein